MYVSGAHKGPLELDVRTVVRHHASAGSSASALNSQAVSPALPPLPFDARGLRLWQSHPYNLHIKIVLAKRPFGL